ncbi:hypothetical protein IFM89_019184, partial [Coptis chinensis]
FMVNKFSTVGNVSLEEPSSVSTWLPIGVEHHFTHMQRETEKLQEEMKKMRTEQRLAIDEAKREDQTLARLGNMEDKCFWLSPEELKPSKAGLGGSLKLSCTNFEVKCLMNWEVAFILDRKYEQLHQMSDDPMNQVSQYDPTSSWSAEQFSTWRVAEVNINIDGSARLNAGHAGAGGVHKDDIGVPLSILGLGALDVPQPNNENDPNDHIEVEALYEKRWSATAMQLQILESAFNQKRLYYTKEEIKLLTTQLSIYGQISEDNIKNWFKNRRVKYKKYQHGSEPFPNEPVDVPQSNNENAKNRDIQPAEAHRYVNCDDETSDDNHYSQISWHDSEVEDENDTNDYIEVDVSHEKPSEVLHKHGLISIPSLFFILLFNSDGYMRQMDLESISYQESYHGAFSSTNAAMSRIEQKLDCLQEILNVVIGHPNAMHSDSVMAYDNAISALGNICRYSLYSFDVVPAWLSCLPIKGKVESRCPNYPCYTLCHGSFCSLVFIYRSNAVLLGPNNQYLPKIVAVFAEVHGVRACFCHLFFLRLLASLSALPQQKYLFFGGRTCSSHCIIIQKVLNVKLLITNPLDTIAAECGASRKLKSKGNRILDRNNGKKLKSTWFLSGFGLGS